MSESRHPRPARRLLGLDQARAVAILAMLAAHFAPGVFAQVPRLEPWRDGLNGFARLATPTFVVVFGVTIGFVYLPRYVGRDPRRAVVRLYRRTALMLVCAVVIAVPTWVQLAVEHTTDPWKWPYGLYSVLLFYALALVLLPAWLRLVGQASNPAGQVGNLSYRCLVAGVALWVIGTEGHRLLPEGPPAGPEFVRTVLASGSFAYFQLMGTALLAVPIGWWLHRRWEADDGPQSLIGLLVVALGLSMIGAIWGLVSGEYVWGPFLAGDLRTPPRAWYFLHVGGVGLALIPALELATRALHPLRRAAYLLALFGQEALVIFTGHVFVLPALALADQIVPLHGAARVVAAIIPFAFFCGLVMYARHRRLTGPPRCLADRRAATSLPVSTRSSSAHSLPSR